jgi:hypothetical protein
MGYMKRQIFQNPGARLNAVKPQTGIFGISGSIALPGISPVFDP